MKLLNTNPYIKSVRIYEEDDYIKLDYRTKPNVKMPKGKKGNRLRFSTGIAYTKKDFEQIEKNKFSLAQEHYESLFEVPEYNERLLFLDVANVALKEAEVERRKTDGTKDYENILHKDVLPFFGKMYLDEIKVKDIKAWMMEMSEQNISQSRFNKKHYVLNRVMSFALENEYITTNPVSLVKRSSKLFTKAKDKSCDYFSKEEVQIILNDTCENGTAKEKSDFPFIQAFMHIALLTGARTGEIMALKKSDIDFTNSTITFQRSIRKNIISTTKTGKNRTVPMVSALKKILESWVEVSTCEYIFPRPFMHKPYGSSKSIVDRYYKPMLKRLGLDYKIIYNTRHAFASISIENNIPLATVSRCLGHNTISTTERFYLQFGNMNQDDMKNQLECLSA